jgi:hypothetical protein
MPITSKPTQSPTTIADRDTPGLFVARPRTLRERMRYLEEEARRILVRPEAFTLGERQWPEDMLRAGTAEAQA